LDDEKVLESLDFFPTANFIYSLQTEQTLTSIFKGIIPMLMATK